MDQGEQISRIGERTNAITEKLSEIKNEMHAMRGELRDEVKELRKTMEKNYVSRDEFVPVRNLCYGIVKITLAAVITAVLGLVLLK